MKTNTEKSILAKTNAINQADGQIKIKKEAVDKEQKAYDLVNGPLATSERGVQQLVLSAVEASLATHNNEKAVLAAIAARAAAAHVAAKAVEATV